MKNKDYFFPHDYNSINDLKVAHLINTYGGIAYSVFWRLVELMHQDSEAKLPLKEYVYQAIAIQLRIEPTLVKNIIELALEIDLFIREGEFFASRRVRRNIKKSEELSQKRREAIQKRWNSNTNVLPGHTDKIISDKIISDNIKDATPSASDTSNLKRDNPARVKFGRYPFLIAEYYCGVLGKSSPQRQLPAAKELLLLAQKEFGEESPNEWFEEIKGRIDVAFQFYKSKQINDWNLSKVAENWDKILKEWRVKIQKYE